MGLKRRLAAWRDDLRVGLSFRHLHGPRRVDLAPDQAGLVLMARDAAWFLPLFLDHHLALGVSHILLIDNGSSDETVALARRSGVTVLRSGLLARHHEVGLRASAARRVFRGGWVMFADADELAEMPLGTALPRLLRYCNGQGFTAVVGQMLDLYDPDPVPDADYARAVAGAVCYSLGAVEPLPYHGAPEGIDWALLENRCADPGVRLLQGGLRRECFGENPFLSKHTLVRNLPGIGLMTHPHCASRVAVADVTLCLRHYKLAGDWRRRDAASVAAGLWEHNEDARRVAAAGQAGFRIDPPAPRVWRGAAVLAEEGFLYASATARAALG